jgi:hypothetical protein
MFYTLLLLPFFALSIYSSNLSIPCNSSSEIVEFKHNFCESRLQNNNPPEIANAYTSLFITIVPLYYGFPENDYFTNVGYSLFLNGFASFYYHYYLNWLGKQADEITMILANFFGIAGLIQIRFKHSNYIRLIHLCNFSYMYLFLTLNTLIYFDPYFPLFFGIYIAPSLFLIRDIANTHKEPYIKYLAISAVGASCWFISELFCNKYTVYGHVMWHLLFPIGFYKILIHYDLIYSRLYKLRSSVNLALIK